MVFKARQEQGIKVRTIVESKQKLKNAYASFYAAFNANGKYYLDFKNELTIRKYLKKIGELL